VSLFSRKKVDTKKKVSEIDPDSDEGIVGLFHSILRGVEDDFGQAAKAHLERLHAPGGYAREKADNDFMELGMRLDYIEALDDVEFTVDDSVVAPQVAGKRRGMAQVVSHWSLRGVQNRPLYGIAPNGQQVTIAGLTFTTFRNYNIRMDYTYWEFPELTRRATGQ
jgi:predicted ester cyclase